jgi:ferrous iron transport protein A
MSLPLSELAVGQSGVVLGFKYEDNMTDRLMQLGIIEGVEIKVIRVAPSGDPIELNIAGYGLSMRKADAEIVLVQI